MITSYPELHWGLFYCMAELRLDKVENLPISLHGRPFGKEMSKRAYLSCSSVIMHPRPISNDALATLNTGHKATYNNETQSLDLSNLEITLIDAIHSSM